MDWIFKPETKVDITASVIWILSTILASAAWINASIGLLTQGEGFILCCSVRL